MQKKDQNDKECDRSGNHQLGLVVDGIGMLQFWNIQHAHLCHSEIVTIHIDQLYQCHGDTKKEDTWSNINDEVDKANAFERCSNNNIGKIANQRRGASNLGQYHFTDQIRMRTHVQDAAHVDGYRRDQKYGRHIFKKSACERRQGT
jgi:hypothetical protein